MFENKHENLILEGNKSIRQEKEGGKGKKVSNHGK